MTTDVIERKPAYYIGDSNSRSPRDFYPTDPRAVEALLKVESFPGVVWEAACGDGAISNVLLDAGCSVYSSDIFDYGLEDAVVADFFSFDARILGVLRRSSVGGIGSGIGSIITNPPYQINHKTLGIVRVEDWIQHAYDLGIEKTALLLKTVAIAGKKRSPILRKCGFSKLYQFEGRLDIMRPDKERQHKNSKSMIDFAWFIFERNFTGDPTIHWITI